MLIQKIKEARLAAMKSGDKLKSNLLGLVIGTLQQDGKTDDADVVRVCQKLVKNNKELISSILKETTDGVRSLDHQAKILDAENENSLLETFLPKSWSEEEIREAIKKENLDVLGAASEGQAMGLVTKTLKSLSKAPFDGKLVRSIVAELRGA